MMHEDPNYYIVDKVLMKKIRLFDETEDEFIKSKKKLLRMKIKNFTD
jgi:hypothetical protein